MLNGLGSCCGCGGDNANICPGAIGSTTYLYLPSSDTRLVHNVTTNTYTFRGVFVKSVGNDWYMASNACRWGKICGTNSDTGEEACLNQDSYLVGDRLSPNPFGSFASLNARPPYYSLNPDFSESLAYRWLSDTGELEDLSPATDEEIENFENCLSNHPVGFGAAGCYHRARCCECTYGKCVYRFRGETNDADDWELVSSECEKGLGCLDTIRFGHFISMSSRLAFDENLYSDQLTSEELQKWLEDEEVTREICCSCLSPLLAVGGNWPYGDAPTRDSTLASKAEQVWCEYYRITAAVADNQNFFCLGSCMPFAASCPDVFEEDAGYTCNQLLGGTLNSTAFTKCCNFTFEEIAPLCPLLGAPNSVVPSSFGYSGSGSTKWTDDGCAPSGYYANECRRCVDCGAACNYDEDGNLASIYAYPSCFWSQPPTPWQGDGFYINQSLGGSCAGGRNISNAVSMMYEHSGDNNSTERCCLCDTPFVPDGDPNIMSLQNPYYDYSQSAFRSYLFGDPSATTVLVDTVGFTCGLKPEGGAVDCLGDCCGGWESFNTFNESVTFCGECVGHPIDLPDPGPIEGCDAGCCCDVTSLQVCLYFSCRGCETAFASGTCPRYDSGFSAPVGCSMWDWVPLDGACINLTTISYSEVNKTMVFSGCAELGQINLTECCIGYHCANIGGHPDTGTAFVRVRIDATCFRMEDVEGEDETLVTGHYWNFSPRIELYNTQITQGTCGNLCGGFCMVHTSETSGASCEDLGAIPAMGGFSTFVEGEICALDKMIYRYDGGPGTCGAVADPLCGMRIKTTVAP